MTAKLVNGDYQIIDNDLVTVDYIDEILQNVFLALNAKRGKFYPNKSFGSRIHSINQQPYDEYALCYARQAVDEIDGVYIKSVKHQDKQIIFTVSVNDAEGEVIINVSD